jgi:hypothetical protein
VCGLCRHEAPDRCDRPQQWQRRLLRLVFVVASVVTATLSLDATVVLLTPMVLATAAGWVHDRGNICTRTGTWRTRRPCYCRCPSHQPAGVRRRRARFSAGSPGDGAAVADGGRDRVSAVPVVVRGRPGYVGAGGAAAPGARSAVRVGRAGGDAGRVRAQQAGPGSLPPGSLPPRRTARFGDRPACRSRRSFTALQPRPPRWGAVGFRWSRTCAPTCHRIAAVHVQRNRPSRVPAGFRSFRAPGSSLTCKDAIGWTRICLRTAKVRSGTRRGSSAWPYHVSGTRRTACTNEAGRQHQVKTKAQRVRASRVQLVSRVVQSSGFAFSVDISPRSSGSASGTQRET